MKADLASSAFAREPALIRWMSDTSASSVIDARYPSATEFDTHRHDAAYLCLPLSGGFTEWQADPGSAGTAAEVQPGQVTLYPVGSQHAVRTQHQAVRIVHVADPAGRAWTGVRPEEAAGLLWQLAREVCERGTESQDDASDLQLESLVLELRPGTRTIPASSPWLDPLVDQIRQDPSRAVHLRELSAEAGVHPSHFARGFKARFGMALGEFVRRLRVAEAVRRLRFTGDSIAAIAADLRFADQSHMGRFFKRFLGATPGQIRAGWGGGPD